MSLQPTNDDNIPAVYDAALTDVADILDAARQRVCPLGELHL